MDKEKERLPYRLTPILEFLLEESRTTDSELEKVIDLINNQAKSGGLSSEVAAQLLVILIPVAIQRSKAKHVLNLLLESGMDAALAEVERIQAKRRNGLKK